MTRLFGFLLAVVGLVSQANAALLVKYDFTGATPADRAKATFAASGVDASVFSGNGNFTTAGFFTGATNLNNSETPQGGFTLSALTASGFVITKINYQFRGSTTTSSPNTRTQSVTLGLSSGENSTESQQITSSLNPLKLGTLEPDAPGLIYTPINDLGPLGINFASRFQSGGANNGIKFQLDYVEVYGELVPEPASMAVFGLLAAPVAFRRLRRRS